MELEECFSLTGATFCRNQNFQGHFPGEGGVIQIFERQILIHRWSEDKLWGILKLPTVCAKILSYSSTFHPDIKNECKFLGDPSRNFGCDEKKLLLTWKHPLNFISLSRSVQKLRRLGNLIVPFKVKTHYRPRLEKNELICRKADGSVLRLQPQQPTGHKPVPTSPKRTPPP